MNKNDCIEFLLSITDGTNDQIIKKYFREKYDNAIEERVEEDNLSSEKRYYLSLAKNAKLTFQEKFIISLVFKTINKYKITKINLNEFYIYFEMVLFSKLKYIFREFEWDIIKELSYEKYEKNPVSGINIFVSLSNVDVDYILKFDKRHQYSAKSSNVHGIRKLFELLDKDTSLLIMRDEFPGSDYHVMGICQSNIKQGFVEFKIIAPGKLTCSLPFMDEKGNYKTEELFRYNNSRYNISGYLKNLHEIKEILDFGHIKDIIKEKYPDNVEEAFDTVSNKVYQILSLNKKLNKGAIIIFINNRSKINDMIKYGRMFECTEVDDKMLQNISKIDGAVICDYTGKLCGYGAILDGIAYREADLQRGSRYNSTVTFVNNFNDTFGIVVSEDGMINIIVRN